MGEESLVDLSLAENLPLDNLSGWNISSLNTVESLPHMRYGPLEKWVTVVVVAILEKLVKEGEENDAGFSPWSIWRGEKHISIRTLQ